MLLQFITPIFLYYFALGTASHQMFSTGRVGGGGGSGR